MKAPNNSSDALSTREAEGLAEGNGRLADRGIEDDSAFILFDAAHSSIGFSDGGSLSYAAVGLRKCSGRGPRPMKRAGSCRRIGNHFSRRTMNGKEFLRPEARPVTTRRWIKTCIPWIRRVGHSRRVCTFRRSSTETGPLRNLSASRFAV